MGYKLGHKRFNSIHEAAEYFDVPVHWLNRPGKKEQIEARLTEEKAEKKTSDK